MFENINTFGNLADVEILMSIFPLAIPLAISGISALGGLLSNRKKTLETTQDFKSTDNIDSTNMPTYDPQQQIMRSLLMNQFLGRTEDDSDFFRGYQREGIGNINQQANLNDESIQNLLANRGLGRTSAGASALIGNQLNRGRQISSLNNQIPLMADARRRQNLMDASGFFGQLPVGQHVTGMNTRVGSSKGTQTDPGNPMGGLFGNLAGTLSGLYGMGAFGNEPTMNHGPGTPGTYPNLPTTGVTSGVNIGYRPENIPYGPYDGE